MEKKFIIGEAVKFGWEKTKGNLGFLIGTMVIILLLNLLGILLAQLSLFPFGLILGIIQKVASIILTIGLMKISLKLAKDETPVWADLYNCYPLFWKYLGSAILVSLSVLIGLILLIVPGIIVAIQFSLFVFLLIEKNMGPVEVLKESSRLTKGSKWNLFLFGLVTVIINFIGAIPLGVGLLITVPVTLIAWAYIYKKLDSQSGA